MAQDTEQSEEKVAPRFEAGRGAPGNIQNRFDTIQVDPYDRSFDQEEFPDEFSDARKTKSVYLRDHSRSILTRNDSPDIGFTWSINPYRGCEHGCIYCYARPTHEYLGLSAGTDFESKIFVKEDAAVLLREKLCSPSWKPETVAMSGVTDCYQPVERKLKITRGCLEVFAEFQHPVFMITKNHLITRDIDLLAKLASLRAAAAFISVTTLDPDLAAVMEPRTSRPEFRLRAIRELSEAGIPVGVNVAPVIPGLTDTEMPKILEAAAHAGAKFAGYTPVRLPHSVAPLFTEWLGVHRPERKEKVLNRIREMRGGKLNDPNFNSRMRGEGQFADQFSAIFKLYCKRLGLNQSRLGLSADSFVRRLPKTDQLDFFG